MSIDLQPMQPGQRTRSPPDATPGASAPNTLKQRLGLYARLIRFDKPAGTWLLLWPTLTALWIAAQGVPPWHLLAVFVLGTFLMRSAGCAINDVADRKFDAHVKRTADRVIASGLLSAREGVWVAVVLAALAALLLLALNRAVFFWALAAVAIAATYPLFKRFFPMPQAYLGIAFSFGIPMAFAAVQGAVPAVGWWLLAANLFWVIAYDTAYAMVDRDDDVRIGLRSSAVLFGRVDVLAIMACYGLHLALLLVAGSLSNAGLWFFIGLAAAGALALYHYTLIRTRDRERCLRSFRQNHWLGFVVLVGVVLHYVLG